LRGHWRNIDRLQFWLQFIDVHPSPRTIAEADSRTARTELDALSLSQANS
jgi:hypothetical protein